jgi:starch synthase
MNQASSLRSPAQPSQALRRGDKRERQPVLLAPKPPDTANSEASEKVLFVTSEMRDFIKAGGLGDVSAALPRVLSRDHDIRVLLPGYRAVLEAASSMKKVGHTRKRHGLPACDIGELTTRDGLRILVVCNDELFNREGSPYTDAHGDGWKDNDVRFATLSSVAADIASGHAGLNWRPDLLHLNDWPCALAACYLDWRHEAATPSVLTIHNLAYQGLFPESSAQRIGAPDSASELDFHGEVSFLRGGMVRANCLTTVSDSYAEQIIEPVYGCGMDRLLARRRKEGRLIGILNGIDPSWNPLHDSALPKPFSIGQ